MPSRIERAIDMAIARKHFSNVEPLVELAVRVGDITRGEALRTSFPYIRPANDREWAFVVSEYKHGELLND